MKVQTTNIRKRIEVSPRKADGIKNFDIDNAYPERCDDIVNASPTGKACVGLFSKFVEGGGFKDSTFYKSVCNDHGLTIDKLLRKHAKDYTGHNGIAIHFNYNALFEKSEVNYIPFDHIRLTLEDGEYAGKYAVYHDWAMEEKSRIDKEKLFFIDKYNPDPIVISEQVIKAGGWDKYKGQILWWSASGDKYPIPIYDSVLEDMQTESELKLFKNRNVTTNFLASHILITDKIEDTGGDEGAIPLKEGSGEDKRPRRNDVDQKEREFMKYLQEYQGADNTGKILWIQKETPEQTIDLKKMDIQDVDKLYQYTETSTRDNIVRSFLQPPILVAILVSGKLGSSKEINDATEFYNKVTDPDRRIFEEVYKQSFTGFYINVNPSGDYSIIPLKGINTRLDNSDKIMNVLNSSLHPTQKSFLLVDVFGYEKAEADALANVVVQPNTETV